MLTAARRQIGVFPRVPPSSLILHSAQPLGIKSQRIISDPCGHFRRQHNSILSILFEKVAATVNKTLQWISVTCKVFTGQIDLFWVPPHCPLHPLFCVTPASCFIEPGLGGGVVGGGMSFPNRWMRHTCCSLSVSVWECVIGSPSESLHVSVCPRASLSVFRFLEISAFPVCGWRILKDRMKIQSTM